MPRKICDRCKKDFLTKGGMTEALEYCEDCTVILKKIADGEVCPNCGEEPFLLVDGVSCKVCGYFLKDFRPECHLCGIEIVYVDGIHIIENLRHCHKCHKEKTKPPEPETFEQQIINIFTSIDKSLKIIADEIEKKTYEAK